MPERRHFDPAKIGCEFLICTVTSQTGCDSLEKEMNTIMNKDIAIFICFEKYICNIFAKVYLHKLLKISFYVYIYIFNKI